MMDETIKDGGPEFVRSVEEISKDRDAIKTLIALRASQNKSQKDIAELMNCTQSKISKLERSVDSELTIGDLRAYLKAVGCAASLFVTKKNENVKAVIEIKSHFSGMRRALNRLLEMAQNDPEIASGIAKFSNDMTYNLFNLMASFVEGLPESARSETPTISIEAVEFELQAPVWEPVKNRLKGVLQ